MTPIRKTFQYGPHQVTLETGEIARQAKGAVMVNMADTVVLVTTVAMGDDAGRDFFPLTVNYQERSYAAGRIPGGYFRREGRPTEKETLTSRLIDRPLRPLFPEGFAREVQVIATVLSLNPEVDADIPSLIGAAASVALAGLPITAHLGAAKVGYRHGQFLLNPTASDLKTSELELVVAGTESAVLMVESEAKELPEEVMLGAVMFGHRAMQLVIQAIKELVAMANPEPVAFAPPTHDTALLAAIDALALAKLTDAYSTPEKKMRQQAVREVRDAVMAELVGEGEGKWPEAVVKAAFGESEYRLVRRRILDGLPRIDGRDNHTVRPITIRTGMLPRTHGSALFTRGETQALVVATLGTTKDAQIIDAIEGEYKENFLLHYNFPPFCVGETGQVGSPKRREIGHGRLARRGVQAIMPEMDKFPYVVRVVSEITESNGSSSMASVCGSSLALMDAGVPVKAPVAGIAMGLIKEADRFAVLTDILGDEDHLGDMDFKVAGSDRGVTALQMDIKIDGITEEIMKVALTQAKAGRLHILGIMNEALPRPRAGLSEYAPRIVSIRIDPDKIRDVIGKGGVMIRSITEETGATIDIDDDGTIRVASVNKAAGDAALRRIQMVTADVEIGKVYEGKVTRVEGFGAFVSFLPNKEGLVHISQMSDQRIANASDVVKVGDMVPVKVLEVDKQGRVRLSMRINN